MTSEVTQADRDAAAEWLWDPESVSWDRRDFDKMKSGSWDDHSLIQAFARHRTAEVERLREALRSIAEATSAEDDAGENYRWDDREGALDYAYATARAALGEP